MPDHDTHDTFDYFCYGCSMGQYRFIHQMLDTQWVKLFGKEHRRIAHDDRMVLYIERTYGPIPAAVAKSHIALDMAFSGWKRRNGFNTYQRHPRLKGKNNQEFLHE